MLPPVAAKDLTVTAKQTLSKTKPTKLVAYLEIDSTFDVDMHWAKSMTVNAFVQFADDKEHGSKQEWQTCYTDKTNARAPNEWHRNEIILRLSHEFLQTQ